jgi:hypothetical protein
VVVTVVVVVVVAFFDDDPMLLPPPPLVVVEDGPGRRSRILRLARVWRRPSEGRGEQLDQGLHHLAHVGDRQGGYRGVVEDVAAAAQAGAEQADAVAAGEAAGGEALAQPGEIGDAEGVLQLGQRAERQAQPVALAAEDHVDLPAPSVRHRLTPP